jgi:iron complex outermembrane receptor protein
MAGVRFVWSKTFPRVAKLARNLAFALLISALLYGNHTAFAQSISVTGKVVDDSGAAVAHAQVTLKNSQPRLTQHAATDDAGSYVFTVASTGEYTLIVEAPGFARYEQTSISAQPYRELHFDVQLKLAVVTQSITVHVDELNLEQVPSVAKIPSKLEDIPSSIQIIGADVVNAQGGIALKDAIRNSSGIARGGSDSFGFNDRFLIRGMDARIYNDGFSDGDQRNGIPHSLNGVERVEVLEGPGSSLFGSGPPGGTINVVHFAPASALNYGGSFETGSFGLISGNAFITGTTNIQGLNFRIDGLAQHEDGFRSLKSADYELRPELSWTSAHHKFTFAVDARDLQATPDPAGLIYVNGTPITGVSNEAKYSTPFSYGDQALLRTTATDDWTLSSYLTITNRFSYMYRNLSIQRNGDGGTVTGIVFSGRQLRNQHDTINDFDYEFEPVWRFRTGKIRHTLLTGFEAQRQTLLSNRATADLPSITNIFDPVIPETSAASLTFLRDAKHSGFLDQLDATYLGVYAADQIQVTPRFNIRLTAREDRWNTQLTPELFVPGRIFQSTELIEPGGNYGRVDTPLSWSAGATYRILRGITPFFGVAHSNLATFSSESTQNGVHQPESGLEYEAGIKIAAWHERIMFTAAAFDVKRNNVFTLVGDTPVFNDQRTRGAEGNLQLRLKRTWRLLANTTVQNAVLTDNPSNPVATGLHPVGVPGYIFNLWSTYDFRIAGRSGFSAGGGVTYRDKLYGDILNTKSVPAYTTLDAVFSYAAERWSASLGMRNIANTTYFVAANGAGGFVGEPRNVFVQLKRTFGPSGGNR